MRGLWVVVALLVLFQSLIIYSPDSRSAFGLSVFTIRQDLRVLSLAAFNVLLCHAICFIDRSTLLIPYPRLGHCSLSFIPLPSFTAWVPLTNLLTYTVHVLQFTKGYDSAVIYHNGHEILRMLGSVCWFGVDNTFGSLLALAKGVVRTY